MKSELTFLWLFLLIIRVILSMSYQVSVVKVSIQYSVYYLCLPCKLHFLNPHTSVMAIILVLVHSVTVILYIFLPVQLDMSYIFSTLQFPNCSDWYCVLQWSIDQPPSVNINDLCHSCKEDQVYVLGLSCT